METKFLSDGRKVVVIGQLNQVEYIVQEIFVTEQGDEIPSGERFTTKGLHDSPVKSYKDRELEKMEQRINSAKSEVDNYLSKIADVKTKLSAVNDQMKSANRLNGKLGSFDWDLFCDIATGNIKYIVETGFYWSRPQRVDNSDYCYEKGYDGKRYEGLKMISLVWHGEYDHSYNMFNYADGSGSAKKIEVFRNDDELSSWLLDRAEKEHENGRLGLEDLKEIEKYIDVSKFRDELKEKALLEVNESYEKNLAHAERIKQQRLKELGLIDAS